MYGNSKAVFAGIIAGFVMTLVFVLVVVITNIHFQGVEIEDYRMEPFKASCDFPRHVIINLGEVHKKDTREALEELQKELGTIVNKKLFSEQDGDGKIIIGYADGEDVKDGGVCDKNKIPNDLEPFPMAVARLRVVPHTDIFLSANISMCIGRINLSHTPMYVKKFKGKHPFKTYVKHEVLHALYGKNHVTWGCSAFCDVPFSSRVSHTEKRVFEKLYGERCKKSR